MEFNDKEREWIESVLKKLDYVEWDRFTRHGLGIRVYGWIERLDQYKDFVLIDLNHKQFEIRGFNTSSRTFSNQLADDLGINHNSDCIRVESCFDLENMIELD